MNSETIIAVYIIAVLLFVALILWTLRLNIEKGIRKRRARFSDFTARSLYDKNLPKL